MSCSPDGPLFVALLNPPTSQLVGGWRLAEARNDWLRLSFWTDLARSLEAAGFDLAFLPDALAMARGADGTVDRVLGTGAKGSIYLDPLVVATAMSAATERIGVVATVSTSFLPPYDLARRLATLHQLSSGRAGWNIVTSAFDAEAVNMGLPGLPAREKRYDRADDVVAEVLELWEGFPDEALIGDRASGRFAAVDRVHATSSGVGPLTVPGLMQGRRPLLAQAGASDRGRGFAARWADVVFVVTSDQEQAAGIRADLRRRAAEHGRDPDSLRCLVGIQPVVAETDAAAQSLVDRYRELIDEQAAMAELTGLFRADPGTDPAGSATDFVAAHRGNTGALGFEDIVARAASGRSVGELARVGTLSQFKPMPVGSPARVAAELRGWLDCGAADGFMVLGATLPSSMVALGPVIELLRG